VQQNLFATWKGKFFSSAFSISFITNVEN